MSTRKRSGDQLAMLVDVTRCTGCESCVHACVEANGLDNCLVYASNAFSNVTESGFDNIAANLPANVGAEMLTIILK